MIAKKLLSIAILPIILTFSISTIIAQKNYPIPPKTDKLLFYFQRSHNKNTVVYDLNTNDNGKINIDKPVHAYWIRYEEGCIKKELSFIQQKVYGLHCRLSNKENESFILYFNSFKKRNIYLMRNVEGLYKAFLSINGQYAELTAMYIQSENNALGFPLHVKYIDITGINIKDRQIITEKVIPEK